jgi:hypothetical protein
MHLLALRTRVAEEILMRISLALLMLTGTIFIAANGCGSKSETEAKVTGSVVKDGKGLEGVNVGFDAADPKASKGTMTDADGKFATTLKPGSYTVVLTRMVDKKGNLPPKVAADADPALQDISKIQGSLRQSLPDKFTNKAISPFKADVPVKGIDLPPFDVSK